MGRKSYAQLWDEMMAVKEENKAIRKEEKDFDYMVTSLYALYPKKTGRKKGEEKVIELLSQDLGYYEKIRRAIIRYALQCQREETPFKFIRMYSTFINNWEDYSDANFEHVSLLNNIPEVWQGNDDEDEETLYGND